MPPSTPSQYAIWVQCSCSRPRPSTPSHDPSSLHTAISTDRENLFSLFQCLSCLLSVTNGIMVPTGKQTPIQPAEPSTSPPASVPSGDRRAPAPVNEYTFDNPEPPPLDPSYVPPEYTYIQYLSPHGIIYVRNAIRTLSFTCTRVLLLLVLRRLRVRSA